MVARFRFRPHEHLRKGADFDRVYAFRCVVRNRCFSLHAAPNELTCRRLGLSVSRKQGPAVVRNRLRRLLREAFRLTQNDLPQRLDVVLIPQRGAICTLVELQQALRAAGSELERRLARRAASPPRETV